jgi:transposase
MAKPLLGDELWERIAPLLPAPKPRRARHPGRKPLGPRKVLTGILFVLKTGIGWEELPAELGCGCGLTCLNRLRNWQRSGVWLTVQAVLRKHLQGADKLGWWRVTLGPARHPARQGGRSAGPPHGCRWEDRDGGAPLSGRPACARAFTA